jgi:Rieske Fe-S protein
MAGGGNPISRRDALVLAAVPLAALVSCRRSPAAPPGPSLPLAALAEGVRVRVLRGEEPVELLRTGERVRALSLWCPHLGCEVSWDGASRSYRCPCHEGAFDAEGKLLGGPPPGPLRTVPVEIVGDRVVIAPRPRAGSAAPI